MIKNIVFDIGRVLIGFEWHEYVRSLFDERTAEKVTEAMWGTGYWKQLDIALLTDDEILDLFTVRHLIIRIRFAKHSTA